MTVKESSIKFIFFFKDKKNFYYINITEDKIFLNQYINGKYEFVQIDDISTNNRLNKWHFYAMRLTDTKIH